MVRDRHLECIIRAAILGDLLAGKLNRPERLLGNRGQTSCSLCQQKLAATIFCAVGVRSGMLHGKRQACKDQQAAHQQPGHPVRMPSWGGLQNKFGQIRNFHSLALKQASELHPADPDFKP